MKADFLYKYKTDDKKSLNDLLKNKLWVSKYRYLNDPCDLMFKLDKNKLEKEGIAEDDLERLLNNLYNMMYETSSVISFGTSPETRRLWNYYAGGFKGFVACYRKCDIEKALTLADNQNWAPGSVKYTNETTDMTDTLIKLIHTSPDIQITPPNWPSLFSKGVFWKGEHEYRYSVGNHFFKKRKRGRKLCKLKPYSVYVGFRSSKKQDIIDFCKKNGILCFICRPDFWGDIRKTFIERIA